MTVQLHDAAAPAVPLHLLSPRESEVLELLARGHSNAELAAELFISVATVKTHVAQLLRKLRARDRVALVVLAWEVGLLSPARQPGPTGRRARAPRCASRSPRPH